VGCCLRAAAQEEQNAPQLTYETEPARNAPFLPDLIFLCPRLPRPPIPFALPPAGRTVMTPVCLVHSIRAWPTDLLIHCTRPLPTAPLRSLFLLHP